MTIAFRDRAWRISSPRLRTARAARLVWAFVGLPLDMIAQASKEATLARFPSHAPADALAAIGRDRGMRRGPLELAASYRARLLLWLAVWKGAGVGRAMLDQLAAYLLPRTTRIRIWTQTGVIYTLDADGTFTIARAPGLWDWDGQSSLWARFWVIIDSIGGVPWERDGTYGDGGVWGEPLVETWGSTATSSDVQTIRAIVDEMKPAATLCEHIIISFDAAAFDPEDTSPPLPDGTWGPPYKIVDGVAVRNRDDRALYWQGV